MRILRILWILLYNCWWWFIMFGDELYMPLVNPRIFFSLNFHGILVLKFYYIRLCTLCCLVSIYFFYFLLFSFYFVIFKERKFYSTMSFKKFKNFFKGWNLIYLGLMFVNYPCNLTFFPSNCPNSKYSWRPNSYPLSSVMHFLNGPPGNHFYLSKI